MRLQSSDRSLWWESEEISNPEAMTTQEHFSKFVENLGQFHDAFYQKAKMNHFFQLLHRPCSDLLNLFTQTERPEERHFRSLTNEVIKTLIALGKEKLGLKNNRKFYDFQRQTIQSARALQETFELHHSQSSSTAPNTSPHTAPSTQKIHIRKVNYQVAFNTIAKLKKSPVPRTYQQEAEHIVVHHPKKTGTLFFAALMILGSQVPEQIAEEVEQILGILLFITTGAALYHTWQHYQAAHQDSSLEIPETPGNSALPQTEETKEENWYQTESEQDLEHSAAEEETNSLTWADHAHQDGITIETRSLFREIRKLHLLVYQKPKYNVIFRTSIKLILIELYDAIREAELPRTDATIIDLLKRLNQKIELLLKLKAGRHHDGAIRACAENIKSASVFLERAISNFMKRCNELAEDFKRENLQQLGESSSEYEERIDSLIKEDLFYTLVALRPDLESRRPGFAYQANFCDSSHDSGSLSARGSQSNDITYQTNLDDGLPHSALQNTAEPAFMPPLLDSRRANPREPEITEEVTDELLSIIDRSSWKPNLATLLDNRALEIITYTLIATDIGFLCEHHDSSSGAWTIGISMAVFFVLQSLILYINAEQQPSPEELRDSYQSRQSSYSGTKRRAYRGFRELSPSRPAITQNGAGGGGSLEPLLDAGGGGGFQEASLRNADGGGGGYEGLGLLKSGSF